MVNVQRIKAAPVAAAAPGLTVHLQQPVRVIFAEQGFLFTDKRCQPQPGQKAAFVRCICQRAQTVGKFGRVRLQPVSYLALPPIVDLKEIPCAEKRFAAVEVFPNRGFVNILVAVIPAGIPGQPVRGAGAAAQRRKPCVKHLVLGALGKKEGERRKAAAGMLYPGAVALNAQLCGAAVIGKNRVARCLVQTGQKPAGLSAPEIAVGETVALPPLAAVGNKMIIAVTVKAVFFQKEFRDTLNAVLPVPFAQLRAGGPGLVAVHEKLFPARHRPRKRSNSILQRSGGQLRPQADGTAARGDGCSAVKPAAVCCGIPLHLSHFGFPPCEARR